jgi:hypothetical protein
MRAEEPIPLPQRHRAPPCVHPRALFHHLTRCKEMKLAVVSQLIVAR